MMGFQSQFWWSDWGLSYNKNYDEDFPTLTWHWLIIGPLQMRWIT